MDLEIVISKAWDDPDFKKELLEHPKYTIEKTLGIKLPEDIELFMHEQTHKKIHLILPMPPE
ncbi:MAG: NHLP leader peptide family RiPP precursor [Desulfobacterales bacterium]|nr:NHLP leader peptide family RiPP precursor [Desulfobacterales bacterium]MBF0398226.1 NHLP leader peptide family RiPP precursor [Desulfobacterales bacterium]